jgi:Global regulator protein family
MPHGWLTACSCPFTSNISHENGSSAMLVLSRKSRETVVVGWSANFEHILRVTVLEIKGGKV